MGYNTHSFNVELAVQVGLEQALVLQHFYFWHQLNSCNERMQKDGYVWCFTSRKGIRDIFPYLSEQKIRTTIIKLIEGGYVIKGNYNEDAFDKTNWYALTPLGLGFFETTNRLVKITNVDSNKKEKESISKDIPKKENLKLPFDSPRLSKLWKELLAYPEWKKKTHHALELRLATLGRIAKGDVNVAIASIKQTLSKGWLDFYEPTKEYYEAPTIKAEVAREKKSPWVELGMTEEQYRSIFSK